MSKPRSCKFSQVRMGLEGAASFIRLDNTEAILLASLQLSHQRTCATCAFFTFPLTLFDLRKASHVLVVARLEYKRIQQDLPCKIFLETLNGSH